MGAMHTLLHGDRNGNRRPQVQKGSLAGFQSALARSLDLTHVGAEAEYAGAVDLGDGKATPVKFAVTRAEGGNFRFQASFGDNPQDAAAGVITATGHLQDFRATKNVPGRSNVVQRIAATLAPRA